MKKQCAANNASILIMAAFAAGWLCLPGGFSAQAANSVTISKAPPAANLIESLTPAGAITSLRCRRYVGSTANDRGVLGQSFQLDATMSITAITLKVNVANAYDTATPHVIQMIILDDTNADGTPDTQVGPTELFDMAGLSVVGGAAPDFITFGLETPTAVLQASHVYGFEIWWTTADPQHNLQVVRTDPATADTDEYLKGGYLWDTTGVFPAIIAPHAFRDTQFYLQGVPGSLVEDWKQF